MMLPPFLSIQQFHRKKLFPWKGKYDRMKRRYKNKNKNLYYGKNKKSIDK